jgi:hypothetical protein
MIVSHPRVQVEATSLVQASATMQEVANTGAETE